jgi:hypothetical protein
VAEGAAWQAMIAEKLDAQRLVFVDEMGTNTTLSPLYAWAPKGQKARCSVPRNRAKNTTLLASMSVEGMGPTLAAVEGTTNRAPSDLPKPPPVLQLIRILLRCGLLIN